MNERKNNVNSKSQPINIADVSGSFIWVDVAENNYHGERTGKADRILFGEIAELEYKNIKGCGFRISKKNGTIRIHISNVIYPVNAMREWAGNLVYNSYKLDFISAARLITQLQKSGNWSIQGGDSELYDLYENNEAIFPADLKRIYDSNQPS